MFEHSTEVRVRYGEVDRMGYVYYGNYAQYYELGRVETMRALGLNYSEMETNGVMMPVVCMECYYQAPAYYDELLTIVTRITKMPKARVDFHYEIRNENGTAINRGMTQLVFVHTSNMRPTRAPLYFLEALRPYLESDQSS